MGQTYLLDSNLWYLADKEKIYLVLYDNTKETDIYTEMVHSVKSRSVKPIYKLYLLNYDETIKEDVSEYLLDGGNITIAFQNGIRCNANITLDNSSGIWNPSPVSGYLWKDTKFRIDIGLQLRSGEVWYPIGILIPNDPSLTNESTSKTISLQLSDKFASIDGSLGGKIINTVSIPLRSNIHDAYSTLLSQERINNIPYDIKPIRFPLKYRNTTTSYTITKTDETTIGEIGIELADMLSCDIYYDNYGHLNFEEGNYTATISDREIIWEFDDSDLECMGSSMNVNFSKAYNVVSVIGCNINGNLVSYTAKNENPKSPSNIYSLEPHPLRIKDENIYSDDLARQRAEYELFKQGLIPFSLKFKSTFLPHLNVNKTVLVSNEFYGFKNTPFLIQSIDIPISQTNSDISLTMSNISEVAIK